MNGEREVKKDNPLYHTYYIVYIQFYETY